MGKNDGAVGSAAQCLQLYANEHGENLALDGDAVLTDLLTDLLHWAEAEGVDHFDCQRLAYMHFNAEKEGRP